ncbi:MAG: sulfotransferase family protein [Pseudomonadales bacterium]
METSQQITPFFIFGSPRSGTSLLSRMLDSHELLVVPNETLIFKMFSSTLRFYGDLSAIENQQELLRDILKTRVIGYWTPKPIFEDIAPLITKPGFAGVIEAIICSTAKHKQLAAWGEKSPGHVFYWEQIKQAFPDSKVVHIVRDGRDVATSIINARMGPKTYYAAAKMWKSYLEAIEQIKSDCPAGDFVEIKYEELLAEPRENLERICGILGVPYSDSMLNFHEKDTNYQTDSTNLQNLQRPLMPANREKWRNVLSPADLKEFESVAGKKLDDYGYPSVVDSPSRPSRMELAARIATSLAARFVSRARDTQGQKEFLNLKSIQLKRWMKYYLTI